MDNEGIAKLAAVVERRFPAVNASDTADDITHANSADKLKTTSTAPICPPFRRVVTSARALGTLTTARRGEDSGAVLVLVLVFMVVVAVIVGGLSDLIMNDVRNTSNFASQRSLQYAATSATDVAMQSIRYVPLLSTNTTLNASPPSSCGGSESSSVNGAPAMAVWCSTVWTPTSATTRLVTFSTCVATAAAASCAANPLLQALVAYDDYGPGVSSPTQARCVVYCGTGMTVESWLWSPLVPTLTSISTSSGPMTGNTSLTISGAGFASGATSVNFVEESGGAPASDNYLSAASNVSVTSPSSLTATSPAVTEGTTFFVTVTTPTGTSAYGPVFTYSLTAPTVSNINDGFGGTYAASGSTAGGNSVTVTGTGFYAGATVNFVEESGGTAMTPTVSVPASYVSVNSSTSITAVSPGVTVGSTYFVTVTTVGGTSAGGSATSDVFAYSELIPTVSAVSPTTGETGQQVTITGTGFYLGATVYFGAGNSCGTSNPATSVTVVSPSSITAVAPTLSSGGSYCVTVRNTGTSASSNAVTFTT